MARKSKYFYIYSPLHPLTSVSGYMTEHRRVLYDKIGPGRHQCHWCYIDVYWPNEWREGQVKLIADHVDENTRNNEPGNLVPSCTVCNTHRSHGGPAVRDDELFIVSKNGFRNRASERTCKQCGTTFLVRNNEIRKYGRIYCSMRCVGLAKRVGAAEIQKQSNDGFRDRAEIRVCAQCHKEFPFPISSIKFRPGKFCSRACFYEYGTGRKRKSA